MVAVRGDDLSGVPALAERFGVVIANHNAPDQLVLAGTNEALLATSEALRARSLRAARLPVGGAFHTPLMADAARAFRRALADVRLRPASCSTLCTTTVAPFGDVTEDLLQGMTRPVCWHQSILRLHADGVDHFVEVGPGRVLTRLVRRILGDGVVAVTAADLESHAAPRAGDIVGRDNDA